MLNSMSFTPAVVIEEVTPTAFVKQLRDWSAIQVLVSDSCEVENSIDDYGTVEKIKLWNDNGT